MSIIIFNHEKTFVCPCGCEKKFTLSIQQSESYGWNAFVDDGTTIISAVGENQE
jgi:hypothetical protein